MHEAVEMNLNLQWRPQKGRNTKNMECLPREAAGSEQSQTKRVVMWAATSKVVGMRLPTPWGAHIPHQCAPDTRGRTLGLAVWGVISLYYFPIPPLSNRNGYLVPVQHYILKQVTLILSFTGAHS